MAELHTAATPAAASSVTAPDPVATAPTVHRVVRYRLLVAAVLSVLAAAVLVTLTDPPSWLVPVVALSIAVVIAIAYEWPRLVAEPSERD